MKIRSIINYFALVMPLLLGLIGFLATDDDFYICALLSTAATGAIQVIIALTMLPKHSSNLLYTYLSITAMFFIIWNFTREDFYIFAIPPALAIFLTYIIYVEGKKEKIIIEKP